LIVILDRLLLLSHARVTADKIWIINQIYLTLKHTIRDNALQITVTHILVFSFMVVTSLLGSGFQRRTLPFLWVPELSLASATSNSRLTVSLRTLSRPLESESESELHNEWRFTANQFVLPPSRLRITTTDYFFQLTRCGNSPYVTSSLTRRWVCRLQLLLVLASAVILGSEARGTHDHIVT
jgi:hypothetical protein